MHLLPCYYKKVFKTKHQLKCGTWYCKNDFYDVITKPICIFVSRSTILVEFRTRDIHRLRIASNTDVFNDSIKASKENISGQVIFQEKAIF